jgi:tetratricopeptide (TPR) repeat protein
VAARLSSLYDAGTLALHQGQVGDALPLLRLVAQRSKDPTLRSLALGNLGVGLRRLGREEEALAAFEQALRADPESTSARFNLANTLRSLGQLPEALAHYQALSLAHPDRGDIANNMGTVLLALGRSVEADRCFSEAVRLQPSEAHYWGNLAAAQAASGRTLAPLRSLQQALKRNPRSASLLVKLGHHLVEQGHLDAAARAFRTAIRVEPERLDAVAGLATAMHRRGENESAAELLRPLVDNNTLTPNLVATWTQICRRTGQAEAAIEPLRKQLKPTLDPATQVLLQHSLGDILDKTGAHDAAFAAYAQANSLRELKHDPVAHSTWVDRLIAQPIPTTQASTADERPLLIVGMPRSGTSLVEQILASHPDCHGAGELDDLRQLSLMAAESLSLQYPEVLGSLRPATLDKMSAAYLARLCRRAGDARRVTDKMPQNFLYLGLVSAMLPGARIIHCVRDPVDTALSCYFQNFKDTLAFTTRLDWLASWVADYHRLMAHWETHLSLPILHVPYAGLCREPEAWSQAIVDFSGLPWDPQCLSSHTHSRVVRTASYAQVRRPIYQTSIGRSQAYRAHISQLLRLRQTQSSGPSRQLPSIQAKPRPKMLGTGG